MPTTSYILYQLPPKGSTYNTYNITAVIGTPVYALITVLPYSGKFSRVLIFVVFTDRGVSVKIKPTNF